MVSIQQIQTVFSNSFLEPLGLLGLLAVIPLIVFYLVKKEPEEELMPSMMFFMEDKKSGKVRRAFKKLQRNNLLLLHLLIVGLFAAAFAQPFTEVADTAEETVIVFDKSASMSNQLSSAKSFVNENTGSENTLIIVDDDVEVVLDQASSRQVRSYLNDIEPVHTPGNVVNGLELASRYEGSIVVASDLQHSVNDRNAEETVKELRNDGRSVRLFEPTPRNSWGIIDIDPGTENSSIDVKNFMEEEAEIEVSKDDVSRDVRIEPGAVETVRFSTDPGRNIVTLEDDGFRPDNTAYISVPEEQIYDVAFISDRENPYFEMVLDLVDFVQYESYTPPVNGDLDADIYVFGETTRVLSDTVRQVEESTKNGASMIVFGHRNVFDTGFEDLPVNNSRSITNTTVNIAEPQTTSFQTEILETNVTRGSSYASPEEALVKADYGDGEIFFYNINDQDFRYSFIYPVFWKDVFKELVDRPSIDELNLRTGQSIEGSTVENPDGEISEGSVDLKKTGFYETSGRTYAANLVNERESLSKVPGIETGLETDETTERNLQNLTALLIALLIGVELLYLRRIGEI